MSYGSEIADYMARQTLKMALIAMLIGGITFGGIGYFASWYLNAPKVEKPQTVEDWGEWFDEHSKTCPECGGSPDHPMCVEAFQRFQDSLRKD